MFFNENLWPIVKNIIKYLSFAGKMEVNYNPRYYVEKVG